MIIQDSKFQKMYDLSEEQLMLRKTVRDYTEENIVPRREELDKEGKYPRDIHEDMGELGVLGMGIPDEYGGLGMGMLEAALVYEELARGCTGVATAIGANSLGSDPFHLFGTDEQKAKYLPKIAEGAVAAYALTEPNAGSDVGGIQTVARPDPDGKTWKVTGQKTFITNAGVASIYTIFTLTDPSRGPRGMTCFIAEVDPENLPPGISFPKKFDKMGINASETREILFDGFEVKTENIVGGKPNRGFLHAMGVFDASRPMIGSMGIGLARSAFEEALKYAHQRIQFGKPIIQYLGLRGMFVDMWLTVEGARAMVIEGARRVDRKIHQGTREDVTAWSAMAKLMGSEASRITLDALQSTGGFGYMNETPFPKMVRDHKILEIYEGTNQIQREQIALQVLKEFQKKGTAAPPEIEEAAGKYGASGGRTAALAWKVIDATLEQARLEEAGKEPLTARQDLVWLLGEMAAFAEASRALAVACGRSGDPEGHWIPTLGEVYARESLLKVAARAERVLRGVRPGAVETVRSLLEEARGAADGLYLLRDKLGTVLLENPPA